MFSHSSGSQKNKARLAELEAEVRALTERLAQAEADKAQAAQRTQTSSTLLDSIIASLQSLQVSLATATAEASASVSGGSSTPGSSPLTATASPVSNVAARTTASSLSPSPAALPPDAKGAQGQNAEQSAGQQTIDQPMGGSGQTYAGDTVTLNLDNLDFWGSGASVTVPVDDDIPFPNSDCRWTLSLYLFQQVLTSQSPSILTYSHGICRSSRQIFQMAAIPAKIKITPILILSPTHTIHNGLLVQHNYTTTSTRSSRHNSNFIVTAKATPTGIRPAAST